MKPSPSRTRWPHVATGLAGACLLLALGTADAHAMPLWQEAAESSSTRVWPVLLVLTSASFGIERAIEIFWNYVDWLLINVRNWQPIHLKSVQYTQFKSGTSLVLGAILGILVVNFTGMQLFQYLQPYAPALLTGISPAVDVLLTGIILGAGTKPIHDLLGVITQFKNYLGNNAIKQREMASSALADGILKMAQSDTQAMIDVPGLGPARLNAPGSLSGMDSKEEVPAQPPAEQYAERLRNRTAM